MEEFQKQLVKFRDDLLAVGFDGTNCTAKDYPGGPGYQWSFTGSVDQLYSKGLSRRSRVSMVIYWISALLNDRFYHRRSAISSHDHNRSFQSFIRSFNFFI